MRADIISDLKKESLKFFIEGELQQQQTSSYNNDSGRSNPGNNRPRHTRKYSSASTLAIHESSSSFEAFEQLVKKYNLFVYLPHIVPPPGYEESNSYPISRVTRRSDQSESSLPSSLSSQPVESQRTNQMEDAITIERRGGPLEGVAGVCSVPARLTGFCSLLLQIITLIISCALTILFIFHIGGYAYFSDAVTTITGDNQTFAMSTTDSAFFTTSSNRTILDNAQDEVVKLLNKQNDSEIIVQFFESTTLHPITYHGPFEQIPEVQIMLFNSDWELISIIRALCSTYIAICVLWLISIIFLILSLKTEILDLLVLAVPICALLFYREQIDSILFLIAGVVGGLLLCFIFGIVALGMVAGWYRYIDYMNGSDDACLCIATLVRLIKRRKGHTRGTITSDYSIPEATRHANLPYIDDTPVQHFSNF